MSTDPRFGGASDIDPSGLAVLRDLWHEKSARDSNRFRDILDALPAAIYTTDAEGRVTHFNRAAVEMTGRTPELGTDRWCVSWKLYHPDGTPMPHEQCPMAVALREGRSVRGATAILERPDGSRIWFTPYPTPLLDAQGRVSGGINMLVDITGRRADEDNLRRRDVVMAGQREALELAINEAPLEASLAVLVKAAIDGVGNVRAGFYLANADRTALHHIVGMPAEYAQAVDGFTVGPDSLACGLATHTGQAVLTSDVRNDPLWQPWLWMAEKFDYRACWSFPIHSAEKSFFGTLAVYSRQPREATARDIDFCRLLTHTASLIISRHAEMGARKQIERALRTSERRHRQTLSLMPAAVYSCDSAGIITYFNPQAEQMWGRTPKAGDTDELLWGDGQMTLPDGAPLRRNASPMAIALTHGTACRNKEVFIRRPDGTRLHVLLNVDPVFGEGGQVIGAISAFHDISAIRQAEEARGESERRLASELASMKRLHELSVEFAGREDLEAVMAEVMLAGKGLLKATRCTAQLAERAPHDQVALRLVAFDGFEQSFADDFRAVGSDGFSTCAAALDRHQPVLVDDLQSDVAFEKFASVAMPLGVRAAMSFPLVSGNGEIVGVFTGYWDQPHRPDPHELRMLDLFLQQVARQIERRAAEKALEESERRWRGAAEALKDADRRKDEFLATLAHELRNPLAPIRNSLHILRLSEDDSQTVRRVRGMMDRQVTQMVRLVDDLMEISRITRGKIELRKEQVDLSTAIQSAVETSKPIIEAAGHQLTIDLPAQTLHLDADPVRLSQIFTNLLNNAAKYTERGGRIELAVRHQDAHAVVSVRDTGIGIPAHMLSKVFDLFTQVDNAYGRAQGGLGIGLTLVRSLVELHGGSVLARSEGGGRGSEFEIRLPLISSHCLVPGTVPGDNSHAALPGFRILVVDDNRDAAESLAMLLRLLGAEVGTANNGSGALEKLETFEPAAVLLDIGMPELDGLEVARLARQKPAGRNVTLVALTGWGQEEDRRRSREAGFDYHLVKPLDLVALQNLMQTLGQKKASAGRLSR